MSRLEAWSVQFHGWSDQRMIDEWGAAVPGAVDERLSSRFRRHGLND
jgi:hypothetical protein